MICPNCNFVETEDAGFCSKCGQKFGPNKLTIRQFFGDLIDHVFNLDTNFFFTLKRIFIPGQLTLDYFAGHRKKYYHPLRLFFYLMVIHLGVLSSVVPYEKLFEEQNQRRDLIISNHDNKLKLDQIAKAQSDRNSIIAIDSARKWMTINTTQEIKSQKGKDTLLKSGSVPIDSIPNTAKRQKTKATIFGFNPFEILEKIDEKDLYLMSRDSLINKYQVEGFLNRLTLGQIQKSARDPKGTAQFIIGNLSWMMIILIPLLAVFLKLLFFRRKRYFIEHLFYLYHWHSFAFLFSTVLVILFKDRIANLSPLFSAFIILFGFIAWLRFYQQGWFKSMIKFAMMGFVYIFLFTILMLITLILSLGFY